MLNLPSKLLSNLTPSASIARGLLATLILFVLPADSGTLRTYLLLNDEIIEYTGKTSTSFTGCVRGQFDTIASAHSTNDNIESAYRLVGNLRDLSLKLMLSGINEAYVSNEPVISINTYGPYNYPNSVFVSRYNFDQYYGAVSGDSLTITGASVPSNNGTLLISSIDVTDVGSVITVDGTLSTEGSGATFSVTSKYAVLPKFCGLEMTPDQVDVAEFESVYSAFSNGALGNAGSIMMESASTGFKAVIVLSCS